MAIPYENLYFKCKINSKYKLFKYFIKLLEWTILDLLLKILYFES